MAIQELVHGVQIHKMAIKVGHECPALIVHLVQQNTSADITSHCNVNTQTKSTVNITVNVCYTWILGSGTHPIQNQKGKHCLRCLL